MRIASSAPSPLLTEPEPSSEMATTLALRRGTRGAEVERFQAQLERAGHPLPRWGVDGHFGRETAAALRAFQHAQGLPVTGAVDSATLAALEARASRPRTPEYDALFADGVLRVTLAIGYDEAGAHRPEVAKVLSGLVARGYSPATEGDTSEFGLAPGLNAWVRRPPPDSTEAPVVLELVTPETPNAKERFAEAMAGTEFVLYGGHGRYGSGPDFDPIDSPAGNYVIGTAVQPSVVTHGPNDLPETGFTHEYQLLFFSGCSTERYFDELRSLPRGKTTKNLDLLGSTRELYWSETAANLFAVLDGVAEGQDLDRLGATLDRVNRFSPDDTRQFFRGDGFHDNP